MNRDRRKQLCEEYKMRRPEMGILSFRCVPTGEVFLWKAVDTATGFNSIRARLSGNIHPNKRFQGLWVEYGEENFELTILEVMSYEDAGEKEDYSDDLEELMVKCLEENPGSVRVWR